MADPLVSLMNLDSPSNYGGKVDLYSPNIRRNNARTGALSKFLGIEDDGSISQSDMESAYQMIQDEQDKAEEEKAVRATYPAKVAAEAALRGEELKGQYGLQIESAKAKAAEQAKQEAMAAQAQMNRERIDAANARATQSQAGTTERTNIMQSGSANRQLVGQRESRAKLLDTGKVEPTYPPTNGIGDSFKSFFGLGPYDRTTASQAEAAKLRGQNASEPTTNDIVTHYRTTGLHGEALLSQMTQDQPDVDPAEIQQMFQLIEGRQ